MKKLIAYPLAAAAFFGTAFATAVAFLATNHWFGVGDLRAFSFWSTILTIVVAFLAIVYGRLATRLNPYLAYSLAIVIGAILGYVSTFAVWKLLGPWFGAFSFPVFYCWTAGAICACVTATKLGRKSKLAVTLSTLAKEKG